MEVWKSLNGIVEFGEYYEVSNMGNVRSINRIVSNGNMYRGRTLKHSIQKVGYHIVSFSKESKRKSYQVHRLVALAFIPNPEDKPEVNHKDGNKSNNKCDNLEWSTRIENINHAIDNGLARKQRGEGVASAKLTKEDVLEIRKLYETGKYTHRSLANMFNMSKSAITSIISKKQWKHI